MRIDKINDNQIRCFLSKEDMESRQLHLKELAYGTEKARALFHELLREARARFGFEVENMPVMVEAVPLQDDSLVLIVTKVDNPEELDTRFSSFSPSVKSGPPDVDTASTSALSQLLEAIRKEIDGDGGSTPETGQAPAAEKRPAASADGRKSSSADTKNKKTGNQSDMHCQKLDAFGGAYFFSYLLIRQVLRKYISFWNNFAVHGGYVFAERTNGYLSWGMRGEHTKYWKNFSIY